MRIRPAAGVLSQDGEGREMKKHLTQERLKEVLDYNPETGVFVWKVQNGKRIKAGDIAGNVNKRGYTAIGVDCNLFRAHRLAWFYVYGKWPNDLIDHINGQRSDNRICNLRDVSNQVNLQNQKRATSGKTSTEYLGVYKTTNIKPWRAQIDVDKKTRHLGYYKTPEEANETYLKAKRMLHVGCTI
jgi:hypothetical protein